MSAARSCTGRADRNSPRRDPSGHRGLWRSRRWSGRESPRGRSRCPPRWRRRRSRASPCAAGAGQRRCGSRVPGRMPAFPRRGCTSPGLCSPTGPTPSSNRGKRPASYRRVLTDFPPRCCADSRGPTAALFPACCGPPDRRPGRYTPC